jgi:hypothetical protein
MASRGLAFPFGELIGFQNGTRFFGLEKVFSVLEINRLKFVSGL